ncbi:MAG: hypothetical protein ACOX87_15830, partial [Chloroflexota bacterium]
MDRERPTISDRAYRYLLVLYPTAFRQQYGESLAQAYRDFCREARREVHTLGAIWLWLFLLGDLVSNAFAERISEMLHMPAYIMNGKRIVVSVIIGLLWGVLTHFIDDLFYPIPGIGLWLAASPLFFTLLVIALWMFLALVVAWYTTRLQGDLWATGAICAALWSSAIVSSFLYDLAKYDRLQILLAGE